MKFSSNEAIIDLGMLTVLGFYLPWYAFIAAAVWWLWTCRLGVSRGRAIQDELWKRMLVEYGLWDRIVLRCRHDVDLMRMNRGDDGGDAN